MRNDIPENSGLGVINKILHLKLPYYHIEEVVADKYFYIHYPVVDNNFIGLILIFGKDDIKDNLYLKIPFVDNESSEEILEIFSQEKIKIYFVDEHNNYRYRADIISNNSCPFNYQENVRYKNDYSYYYQINNYNSNNIDLVNNADKYEFINIEKLTLAQINAYIDTGLVTIKKDLDLDNPGVNQEHSVEILFQKVFGTENVKHSPKNSNGQEITDIIVQYENYILVIEAKSQQNLSPNKFYKHINKACCQLKGAFPNIKNSENENVITIGLIIVNELILYTGDISLRNRFKNLYKETIQLYDYFYIESLTNLISIIPEMKYSPEALISELIRRAEGNKEYFYKNNKI